MDKVNGLVNVLLMFSWSIPLVEAQLNRVCQFPSYTCDQFRQLCLNGDNIVTDLIGYCGHMKKTPCDYANGPHCQGSQGPQPPTPWSGRFGQNTQPPDPWNRRFTPGYQPTGGARSQQQSCNVQDWRQRALKETNYLRSLHGVQPLQEDPEIQKTSQPYAESQIYIKYPDHNPAQNQYGENVASHMAIPSNFFLKSVSPEGIVQEWYNEIASWDFTTGTGRGITGHFTQLVWKTTQRVGHGIAFDPGCTRVVIIADYSPRGNLMSQARENVLPPNKNPVGPQQRFRPTSAPVGPYQPPGGPGWPSQPNTPMSFGRQIGGSVKKGASIELGKMCSGSSLLLFWLRAKGYMD